MSWVTNALRYLNGRIQSTSENDYLMQAMPRDTVDTNFTVPAGRQYIVAGQLTINSGVTLTVANGAKVVIL